MIFKILLDYQKVQNNFLKVWQVLECLGRFKIFFYDFQKPPGLPEGPNWLFWSLTSPGMSLKLQNIFLWFLKVSWIAWRSKMIFLTFDKSWNVSEASKYFLWFLKVSWIAWRSKIIFLKFDKSWFFLEASKYFSMIFKSLLDCLKVQNNFLEVLQVLECLGSSKYFSMIFESLLDYQKSKITIMQFDKSSNIFQWSYKANQVF